MSNLSLCTCSVAGVGPRKFRTGVTDLGDRSVWTDTPADKLRKARVSGVTVHVAIMDGPIAKLIG